MANIGNAWHIPNHAEPPGQASMRFPLAAIDAGTAVTISNGNQFQGGGGAGNQTQSGSAVLVRKMGDAAFSPIAMQFQVANGNNKYFAATVPAGSFQAGDVVQYYLKIGYTDRDTTFLHGSDGRSSATADEAAAQADPFTFTVRFPLTASGSFLSFDSGAFQARIFQQSGHIALAGPDLVGVPHANVTTLAPPAVSFGDRTFSLGRVVSSTALANGLALVQQLGGHQVLAHLTFVSEGVMRFEVVDWKGIAADRISISAASDANEHFFGFGEKYNALDQAGKVVNILTFDNPGNKGDHSYKVAPWFISSRGYGFHLDSTARSTFDMRGGAADRYEVINLDAGLLLNLVHGPKLTDVLSRYTALTGRPPLPPPYAFGAWISSDVWRNGGEVRYAVTRFRAAGIPVSAFVFDSPWEVAYNDFAFNQTQFGLPGTFETKTFAGFQTIAEMMAFLQGNGLKVICWLTPFVDTQSDSEGIAGANLGKSKNYDAGAAGGFFVRSFQNGPPLVVPWWKGRGSPVDFTKAEARTWFTQQLNDLLTASLVNTKSGKEPAIGGFKPDDGEVGNGVNTYIPDTAVYSDGRTGRQFVNGYCREYQKTVYSVLGSGGLIFARSGFSGSQAFPGCWAGDNQPNFGVENGLPSVIIAGLSAAMSGFSIWGHDVGGYLDGPFSNISPADLFIRWTQFGCFSPIMQMHRQVHGDTLRQYPWGYPEGAEKTDDNHALQNYKFYATLHTRLFPYLCTQAKESSQSGLPILRPLVLLHQDDPRTMSVEHTYYFGGDLLVAPVIEPNTDTRQLYLPQGDWFDFWTNERHTGKQDLTWKNPAQPSEPKSKIPVFVKSGAIVPLILGDDVASLCDANYINNQAVKTWDGGLELRIYPAGSSQFTIFDGTEVRSDQGAGSTSVTVTSPLSRPVLLRILAERPAAVRRDGAVLAEAASAGAFDAATRAWMFDATLGFVLVKFGLTGGTTKVTLS